MKLILYSKPGCHLCEGLHEKLEQIHSIPLDIEVRDITTRDAWFQAYQYEIPVLVWVREVEAKPPADPSAAPEEASPSTTTLVTLPRVSPRASVGQVEQMLQKFWAENSQE